MPFASWVFPQPASPIIRIGCAIEMHFFMKN
jgi:hypothetical protein